MTSNYDLKRAVAADTEKRQFPKWVYGLTWGEYIFGKGQPIPQPAKPIPYEQYLVQTIAASEVLLGIWHQDFAQEPSTPFWHGHIHVYSTYGILALNQYMLNQPKDATEHQVFIDAKYYYWNGTNSTKSGFGMRFFRIGCVHRWRLTYSRMCYRQYRCDNCGQEMAEDSSD